MSYEPIVFRLATLSEQDLYISQAQIARAEAIVDAFAALARLVCRGWNALAARVKASNAARTRAWPHPQA